VQNPDGSQALRANLAGAEDRTVARSSQSRPAGRDAASPGRILRVNSYRQVVLGLPSHKQNVGFPAALHPES
jgi:hypothetical protein